MSLLSPAVCVSGLGEGERTTERGERERGGEEEEKEGERRGEKHR